MSAPNLYQAVGELFAFLDTAPFNDLPVLTLPAVAKIEAVRTAYEAEKDWIARGGGCGFADDPAGQGEGK